MPRAEGLVPPLALPPKETVTANGRPSARARETTCETSRTAGPLQPRWVKRNPPRAVRGSSPLARRDRRLKRDPREGRVLRRGSGEGDERGARGRTACPRAAAQSNPAASARRRGPSGPPSRGRRGGGERARVEADVEAPAVPRRDLPDRRAGAELGPGAPRARDERVAHVAGPVRRGEELRRSASSRSGPPRSSSKKARCAASGKRSRKRSTRRRGEEETKRARASRAGRTLQRPPPETRTFRPGSRAASRTTTGASPGLAQARRRRRRRDEPGGPPSDDDDACVHRGDNAASRERAE